MKRYFLFVAVKLFVSSISYADNHGGFWFDTRASGKASESLLYQVEFHGRFKTDGTHYNQNVFRAMFGKKHEQCSTWLGYDFVPSNNDADVKTDIETRLWQQVKFLHEFQENRTINFRTRLEERLKKDSNGMALRFRHQLTVKIADIFKNTKLLISEELFFNLNHPSWIEDKRIEQQRLFVGLEFFLQKNWFLTIGYLNQVVPKKTDTVVNHIFTVSFVIK